ncbi:beta-glucosidase [Demequina lignilytica]|uniref:Glycoside hydrolase family 3 C-terminal domain-containing protein n=1 Tax=Demequina lignilytica TaxID=3051663 RepID=A0AB35MHP6_9MICO|nr:glycoside hydrolase family 3 C-terminal domain-containing protein [Demequina sp. SYSU T0a273]MDN4483320.1 glycoside hydrolase family 3 C-terminal domain-containing protein [Demequina sp. SYSU T0a273]
MTPSDVDVAVELDTLISQLSLEEKVALLTGRDFWSTVPIERIGLRSMTLSDGPSGVRGPVWSELSPSLNLPSATALSASFDPDMAYRYGRVAAAEARRKGVDVVLGPTINIHRSPLGGRHFECFSEDPRLTADLAAFYVNGLQDAGVGATPKHYIANDFESDRFNVDVEVSERALREVYLLAFERSIVESRAWMVMSAYNSINGATATENDLLATPLCTEWGFDGVVVSDWTAVRSVASANAEQHLAMPGPHGAWGDALVAAVRAGEVEEAMVDSKVRRMLLLAQRVGALGDAGPQQFEAEDGVAFIRAAAAEGMVLLENRGELPWDGAAPASIAVLGSNADQARTQGGGSATVVPEHVVSPLAGIAEAFPDAAVTYAVGALNQVGLAGLPADSLTNPATGGAGVRITFRDADGAELAHEDRLATDFVWFGGDAPIAASRVVEAAFTLTPGADAEIELGCAVTGHARLWIDGDLRVDEQLVPDGEDLGAALLSPRVAAVPVSLRAGVPVEVRFDVDLGVRDDALAGALAFTLGSRPRQDAPEALIAEAVAAAAAAEVAVVVVGTNSQVESEGFDRDSLALPGHQDALVEAVAAANPRTVVIVNAGSPVVMPWRDKVAAVLLGWFGGQEFGHALTDVLTGAAEPGGRLPTTWPAAEADVPVIDVTPRDGKVVYEEGIHVGYKAWLRAGVEPAYWLGHGQGYTTFAIDGLAVEGPVTLAAPASASLTVTNTGDRAGKHVVLLFAERAETAIERPARWLVGHAVVRLEPGETGTVEMPIDARALAHWDGAWAYEAGEFTLRAGATAADLPLAATVTLEA